MKSHDCGVFLEQQQNVVVNNNKHLLSEICVNDERVFVVWRVFEIEIETEIKTNICWE